MEEPAWLEQIVVGDLRLWQIVFICFAAVTSIIVMVCCCFRFRIPRTKQQIEADYQRRKITCKFRQRLETIEDTKMDAMSLHDALELLYEKEKMETETSNNNHSQHSSVTSPPQQNSLEASVQAGGEQKQPQAAGLNFAKFASKVATLSKLGPKSPTSPTPSAGPTNMDF